jgi:hypothetical protein
MVSPKVSGQARDKGYVSIFGEDQTTNKTVTEIDPKNWYTFIGGRNATLGQYVYSATYGPPAGSLPWDTTGSSKAAQSKASASR